MSEMGSNVSKVNNALRAGVSFPVGLHWIVARGSLCPICPHQENFIMMEDSGLGTVKAFKARRRHLGTLLLALAAVFCSLLMHLGTFYPFLL